MQGITTKLSTHFPPELFLQDSHLHLRIQCLKTSVPSLSDAPLVLWWLLDTCPLSVSCRREAGMARVTARNSEVGGGKLGRSGRV